MALILDGTTGASAVQDSSVTDGKLSLTANSAQIKVALNASNGAPIYACRAWVNFNGTGTVAIRASGNVSSITDTGTGNYTVNFTTAMADINYCANALCNESAAGSGTGVFARARGTATSSAFLLETVNLSAIAFDSSFIYVAIFR